MGQIISAIFNDNHRIPDNDYHDYHQYEEKAETYYTFSNIIQPAAPQRTASGTRHGSTRGNYNSYQRILVVGDGDFSFSASLAMAFGSASNMVSTSLDSLDFLIKNYKRSMSNINELKARGCKVLHSVDATQMADHPQLYRIKFDRIIFNFPLAGFFPKDFSRQLQILLNQRLVGGFMANARMMMKEDGEVHITHKSYGFYKQWNLEQLGQSQGLWLREVVNFQLTDYPGYHTKYGFGGDRDFDCNNSKIYKFSLPPFNEAINGDTLAF